jgi:hypothetical protein
VAFRNTPTVAFVAPSRPRPVRQGGRGAGGGFRNAYTQTLLLKATRPERGRRSGPDGIGILILSFHRDSNKSP